MKKILITLLALLPAISWGQAYINGNVELEDFTNWKCYTGMNTTGTLNLSTFVPGIVPGRHTLMRPGPDPVVGSPYLDRTFPYQVFGNAPNPVFHDSFSIRLGNNGTGRQAEIVSYRISALSALDGFSIAMVMQNGHPTATAENPFVSYWVSRSDVLASSMDAGNLLGVQQVPANGSTYFRHAGGDVVFREWTRINLLTAFPSLVTSVGAPVTLYFATADCQASGHFGYAYIDNVFPKSWTVSAFTAPATFSISSGNIFVDGMASVAESKYRWQIVNTTAMSAPTYTTSYFSGFVGGGINLRPVFDAIVPSGYFIPGNNYKITLLTENDGSGSLAQSFRTLLATP